MFGRFVFDSQKILPLPPPTRLTFEFLSSDNFSGRDNLADMPGGVFGDVKKQAEDVGRQLLSADESFDKQIFR
jgi:hypothetical protein